MSPGDRWRWHFEHCSSVWCSQICLSWRFMLNLRILIMQSAPHYFLASEHQVSIWWQHVFSIAASSDSSELVTHLSRDDANPRRLSPALGACDCFVGICCSVCDRLAAETSRLNRKGLNLDLQKLCVPLCLFVPWTLASWCSGTRFGCCSDRRVNA